MKYIDLHVHSTCSDGTCTPTELVSYAARKHLAAFALTDHDTMDGIAEAEAAAKEAGIELVKGVEFSTEYEDRDVHILGLDVQPEQAGFAKQLLAFRDSRDSRNEEMAQRLRTLEGIPVTVSELRTLYGNATITRAHFGRWLFENGYVRSIKEAFDRYLGDDCPCFVPRKRTSPAQAIQLILQAGGIPILAHPLLYRLTDPELEALVLELKAAGLQGLEAIYSTNTGFDESKLRRLARKMDLKISGGSDFHGKNKPLIDLGTGKGNLKIPYEILENLRS